MMESYIHAHTKDNASRSGFAHFSQAATDITYGPVLPFVLESDPAPTQ